MSGLRVLLDQITAPVPGGIGRYALELTRALIDTAPPGADVVGFVPSSPEAVYDTVTALLPGLAALEKSAFDRRQLAAAWQHGFTRLRGDRFTHAPSLLAPLYRHDRVNNQSDQTVVTIHDAVPWTHPQHLTPRGASWHRAMGRRAERFADAVVVPTHAVADEIASIFDLGDRIRVIGGAVASDLRPPSEEEAAHATQAFDLPPRYVVSVGTLEPRKGLDALIHAMASLDDLDVSLVIVGPKGWGTSTSSPSPVPRGSSRPGSASRAS
ncbi:glycosyltransferase [Microcella daejeonensis]|uniref:glycosyltransferase n=1 Tax=Microcella daejeonensis TaxID=2994971 RepID=UPI00227214F3|nr:glycosyltransferase [Microcella daejeonensis]WAB84049.1 glycosyltransferase [Microcella daejeonensis]